MMRRLFSLPWRSARHIRVDVDDELRFHMDERTAALIAMGIAPATARVQALREFGDVDEARKYINAIDRGTNAANRRRDYLGDLQQDLVYALRKLRASPAFTIVAVVTLALGIGANTAIFSVVNAVLLRPLPFPHPEELLKVYAANKSAGSFHAPVSPLDLEDWRAQRSKLADLGGYYFADGGSGIDMTGAGEPQRLSVAFVEPGFFSTLGVNAAAGRVPRNDEMVRGANDKLVVLSYGFWQRQFGGAASAINSHVSLNGEPHQVLGVMPPDFRFPSERVDVYIPYSTIPNSAIPRIRPVHILEVIARVKPGVSISEAHGELNTIAGRLARQYPEDASWDGTTVTSLQDAVTGDVRAPLLVLLAAVAFVLVMGCVNVASLLLARASVRQREMTVRAALGAGRGRIVRQLLTESIVLSLAGGVAGIGVAIGATRAFLALSAGQLPRGGDARLSGAVLLFALAVSVVTGLLFGLVPALRASKPALQKTLREGGRGATGGTQRLRSVLVVAEVALAVILVAGAGLMTRSFVQLLHVDPGFRSDHLLAVNFTLNTTRHPEDWPRVYHEMIEATRRVPGVTSAGAVKEAPFRGNGERYSFVPPGYAAHAGEDPPSAQILHISDGYLKTIGARMIDGREYTASDRAGGPDMAIVNEALAKRWFPEGGAVGRSIDINGPVQIIGVVGDIHQSSMNEPVQEAIYLNNMINGRVRTTLVARVSGDPLQMIRQVRDAIWSVDRDQTITSVFTFDDIVGESMARPRLLTVLLGGFGILGLVLGALGIYGVLSYLVNERQREIGVRIALGAAPSSVLWMFVSRGLVLTVAGLALGIGGALMLTRFIAGVLYDVTPTDPFTFGAVASILLVVAALASWLPARRAAHVDPIVALRYD